MKNKTKIQLAELEEAMDQGKDLRLLLYEVLLLAAGFLAGVIVGLSM